MKGTKSMKKKGFTIFALIGSLFFFFGMMLSLRGFLTIEGFSYANTTEFMATVTKVKVGEEDNKEFATILTKEYSSELHFTNIRKIVDKNDNINLQNSLQKGQEIFFRIDNKWLEALNDDSFVGIISLRTAEEEILTLSEYDEYMKNQINSSFIGIGVSAVLSLLAATHCILLLKGINIFKKLKK